MLNIVCTHWHTHASTLTRAHTQTPSQLVLLSIRGKRCVYVIFVVVVFIAAAVVVFVACLQLFRVFFYRISLPFYSDGSCFSLLCENFSFSFVDLFICSAQDQLNSTQLSSVSCTAISQASICFNLPTSNKTIFPKMKTLRLHLANNWRVQRS